MNRETNLRVVIKMRKSMVESIAIKEGLQRCDGKCAMLYK